jgi:hypothetical protein
MPMPQPLHQTLEISWCAVNMRGMFFETCYQPQSLQDHLRVTISPLERFTRTTLDARRRSTSSANWQVHFGTMMPGHAIRSITSSGRARSSAAPPAPLCDAAGGQADGVAALRAVAHTRR